MERTPNDPLSGGSAGSTGAGAGSALGAGTDSISVTGTGAGQSASTGGYGDRESQLADVNVGGGQGATPMADRASGARDAASEKMQQARDMASERLGQVKEKASQLSSTLADKLEAGANSLRERSNRAATGGQQQLAGMEGTATARAQSNEQMQRFSGSAADAMQKTADFLRTGDVKGSLEEQVRTNPGRTLLVALGVGYALGKVLRRR